MEHPANLNQHEALTFLMTAHDYLDDHVIIIDSKGICIKTNRFITDNTFNHECMIGSNWFNLVHPENRDYVRDVINTVHLSKKEKRFSFRLSTPQTPDRFMNSVCFSLPDSTESNNLLMIISRDITKQKQIEQLLLQAQKMESLGTLTSGIAHDFNNILGIILGYVSRLDQHRDDDERFRKGIETTLHAVERGMVITKMVLSFARKSESSFKLIPLNPLCEGLKRLIDETFPRIISCSLSLDKNSPQIYGNPNQLQQAFINICVNARDAMPEGGKIIISTRKIEAHQLQLILPNLSDSDYAVVTISDTGMGIKDELQKNIFDPFFTTKSVEHGTGLGLAIVKKIINEHNGHIDVSSQQGEGTTFRLFFPLNHAPEITLNIFPETNDLLMHGTETILIVEDEISLAILLRDALIDNGYTVITARDGNEALNLFNKFENEIALVIADIGLPKIDGFRTCEIMKNKKPNLKIVCSTGYIAPDLDERVQKAGFDAVVRKPCNVEEIIKNVRDVLDHKIPT
ncbi:MAG: response regulator [Ignavibacteriales bacterium]|nr:response regulator [Ignavibacteriales bacterium]